MEPRALSAKLGKVLADAERELERQDRALCAGLTDAGELTAEWRGYLQAVKKKRLHGATRFIGMRG